MAKFQSGPTALLSFIMFLQPNICIHVHHPPLSAGDFSGALSGLVKSLSILLNPHPQQKTSGIQGTSPGICHNRGSSIFSLTTSSGIFRGRGYAFAG